MMLSRLFIIAIIISLSSCSVFKPTGQKTKNQQELQNSQTVHIIRKGIFIYKTAKDYTNKVPVTLDQSRNTIIGFPAPADLMKNGKIIQPITLNKGYLYDPKGINKQTGFINMDYENYAQLKNIPDLGQLNKLLIKDKIQFTEMYFCPEAPTNSSEKKQTNFLNNIIKHQFKDCNRLK